MTMHYDTPKEAQALIDLFESSLDRVTRINNDGDPKYKGGSIKSRVLAALGDIEKAGE